MNLVDRIRYILRKYPSTRFSRGEFMWRYIQVFLKVESRISKEKFLEFWKQEAGLERQLRNILKEPEFRPEPKQDSKKNEKAAQFKKTQGDWVKQGLI